MIVSLKRAAMFTAIVVALGIMVVWLVDGGFFGRSSENPVTSASEAIEISRNSSSVKIELGRAISFNCSASYMNVTQCVAWKEEAPDLYEFLPDDHGVWVASWAFKTKDGSHVFTVWIKVYIDEKNAEILGEDRFAI